MMDRQPEHGAMDLPEEVESYDLLSRRYLGLVERRFTRRAGALMDRDGSPWPLVLDVGTGPANIPVRFIREVRPGALVVAVDLSEKMLARARENIRQAGLQHCILPVLADSTALPFREGTFRLTLCHSMLHHLPEPLPSLQEMVRVTARTGTLLIRDLRRPPAWLVNWYVGLFGARYDSLMRRMYRESLHAGFTRRELRALARQVQGASLKVRRFFVTHFELEGRRS